MIVLNVLTSTISSVSECTKTLTYKVLLLIFVLLVKDSAKV